MVATKTDNIQEDLMSRLDSAVSEVFEMMLNRNCAPLDTQVDIDEQVTARIRFSGSITGECLVYETRRWRRSLQRRYSDSSQIHPTRWSTTPSESYAT